MYKRTARFGRFGFYFYDPAFDMLIKNLLAVCDNEMQQAVSEYRWLLEHLLCRRNQPRFTYHTRPNSKILSLIQIINSEEYINQPSKLENFACKYLTYLEKFKLNRYIIQRAIKKKPLQYILKYQSFLSHDFVVRPPTLIPRWETEEWVEKLCELIRNHDNDSIRILELCSGSGVISISLSDRLKNASIRGYDISPSAVKLSRLNKRIINPSLKCEFDLADLKTDMDISKILEQSKTMDANRESGYDIIVCNPPYIKPSEYATLDSSVKDWEDKIALVTVDPEGLEFFERIIDVAPSLLRKTRNRSLPAIVFEIGSTQGRKVSEIMLNREFKTEIWQDLAGKDRTVIGKLEQAPTKKPKPPTSEECCMSGCRVCVWDMYEEEYEKYRKEVESLQLDGKKIEIEPAVELDAGIKAFRDLERGKASGQ